MGKNIHLYNIIIINMNIVIIINMNIYGNEFMITITNIEVMNSCTNISFERIWLECNKFYNWNILAELLYKPSSVCSVSVNEGLELPNTYDDVFVTSDLYVTTHNPPN